MEVKKEHLDKIIELVRLSFTFAKVNRVTLHEDGIRRESDTDHTFMLSLIACSLADSFYKEKLDIGLVSQFALVHDLVEAYAGDTDTFVNISDDSRKIKLEKEKESLYKIEKEFGEIFPYIHNMIERYEKQEDIEARFIKFVDKMMPKLTHLLNNFSYINNSNMDDEYFYSFLDNKYLILKDKYEETFPEVLDIYQLLKEKLKFEHKNLK